jgi:hypothetical protein
MPPNRYVPQYVSTASACRIAAFALVHPSSGWFANRRKESAENLADRLVSGAGCTLSLAMWMARAMLRAICFSAGTLAFKLDPAPASTASLRAQFYAQARIVGQEPCERRCHHLSSERNGGCDPEQH